MSLQGFIGPMASGKTKKLIEIFLESKKTKKIVLKPIQNTRDSKGFLASRNGQIVPAVEIEELGDLNKAWNSTLILVDECHFFEPHLIEALILLAKAPRKEVIFFGLDYDWLGNKFEGIERLEKESQQVTVLYGVCKKCGKPSSRTAKRNRNGNRFEVGGDEEYYDLCFECFKEYQNG